jgi:hypothetical protein
VVATQRAALAYARPLNSLLASLVDAQYAAARGTAIDEAALRANVDEVNRVDHQFAALVQIEQRWPQLAGEIDSTISLNARGPGALRAYATPIALTRGLLDWIADSSLVTGDPASPQHLISAALHQLPDVVASAGELAALAFTTPDLVGPAAAEANRQLTIAQDRVARMSSDVGGVLRAGASTSGHTADIQLLMPLDEFAAAAQELNDAAAELGPSSATRERVEETSSRLRAAAIALETAAVNAFDAQLVTSAAANTTHQRLIVLACVVMAFAVGGLLWLLTRSPAAPETVVPGEQTAGRDGLPVRAGDTGPNRPEQPAHLVDARELVTRDSTLAGRVVGARKR